MDEDSKTILKGRLYPSIQNSVRNRYLLILGFFAICGFYFAMDAFRKAVQSYPGVVVILCVFLSLFSIHNYANYYLNAKEQRGLEPDKEISWFAKYCGMELFFMILFLLLNSAWLSWLFLSNDIVQTVNPANTINASSPMFVNNLWQSENSNVWDKIIRWGLIPLIAAAAVWIAVLQYKINKRSHNYSMYDRRLHVYEEVKNLIRIATNKANWPDLINFREAVAEADFLFNREITEYLEEFFNHVNNLCRLEAEYRDVNAPSPVPQGYDHQKGVNGMSEERMWLIKQVEIAKEKFRKYLSII